MIEESGQEGDRLRDEGKVRVSKDNEDFLRLMRYHARIIDRLRGQVCCDDLRKIASKENIVPTHPNSSSGFQIM